MNAFERRALAVLVLGAACLRSSAAVAQSERAQQMFEEGRRALASEDYVQARESFAASYRAEPAVGTLLNLAVCEEKLGLLNAAAARLNDGLRQVGPEDKRRASIEARLTALRARIPHLVLRSRRALDAHVRVTIDDRPVPAASLGARLPVDPGRHVIRCTDSRGTACFHEAVVGEAQTVEAWILPVSRRPPPAKPPPARAATVPPLPVTNTRTVLAVSTGAVGLAGIAVGLFAGNEVLQAKSAMSDHCDGRGCDREGIRAAERGRTWSLVSTVATGVGALGLGTSAYLMLTAPTSQETGTALTVRGAF